MSVTRELLGREKGKSCFRVRGLEGERWAVGKRNPVNTCTARPELSNLTLKFVELPRRRIENKYLKDLALNVESPSKVV